MASTYNKEWNNLSIEEKRDVIRVALKNGIRELPDIKAKYNEFAGGGSFYQKHRARWNNYLLRHGVPEQQAAKLSSFFSAQDALESGHGTSDAARRKNNFGGMQRLDKKSNKMVNISYPSVDAYMDAKWKMMQNRFGRALNANSIQEYSNLLNDPRYHGKGYMYALYEGYRDGKPLDVAKQTQHMNNYTRILMDIAGEKGFKGAPVPAGQAEEAPASIAKPENPYTQYTPAEPFFNQNMTFVRPEDVRKAQEEKALRMAESQNAAMQQERKQSVDSFNTLMGLLHTPNNGNSGILGTIATLASLNKNNRFDTGGVKQQPRQHIYDVLPSLFAKDGVKITVSSGFRPGAKTVEGKPSRHSLKQAADIVGDFKAIRRVLDDPNSYTSRWLLSNGYGYLDETSATGTTKFWHDHKRDHSHYHIGMDSGIVSKYANMMRGRAQNPLPVQQDIVEQPIELAQTSDIPFTPSNPQAFFGVHPAQQQSVYDYVTTPTVEQPVYDPMVEEKNDALSNLSKFNAIMQLTSPSNSGNNNFLNTVGLLANMSADGGKIHIKPENRGKFTALKERTGHSATWFKEHGTPAQKKMATFALNSRHWKHGYGGHIYDGTTEDSQQMNIPYAGELPDVTVMPRRIANKAWDKVQERWVGDIPTYYAVNPETGKEEMLREIGNGKYSTYDDRHVFDVLGAEAAKKEREQWVRNGGTADDFDKVMLGTLGLGLAPIALPEIAAGVSTALANPYVDAGLTSYFGAHGLNHAINEGIDGWGDAAMTALELAPLGRLAKPLWNAATSTRNFIPTLESNMSGIRYAYNRNPELANIGTLEDYNNYLKTVFPESKVKDINYHMGPKGLQELKPNTGKVYNTNPDARGIYVTPDKSYAQRLRKYTTDRLEKPSFFTYIKRNLVPGGWDKANDVFTDIYPVMVDTKNPLLTKGTWTWGIKDKKYQSLMDDYDAIVNSGPKWYQNFNSMPEIIVPKTEQSLILGSDTDVAGFRRFMSNPQITAENAGNTQQQIGDVMSSSSFGDAANAVGDINNFKSDSSNDLFKLEKIKAFLDGDPYFKADFGPYGIHKESFPSDWTITKMPFSDKSKEIMTNTAKPRILTQAEKDIRSMYDPAIDGPDIEKYIKEELSDVEKQLDEKIKQGYDLGSEEFFKFHDAGKTSTYTGGLQRGDNGQIVLRDGQDPEKFAVHEWEHRRTNRNIKGEYYGTEKRLLRKAFTKEFRELSETVPDFKGMKMDEEMVTTNSDARAALLGETHLRKTPPELQNKIIDASSDEKVFDAVKKANAYGYYYIKKMEESGKLTHELAMSIRESMKHVGAVATPVGVGLTAAGIASKTSDKK